jgi:hypothetical protein
MFCQVNVASAQIELPTPKEENKEKEEKVKERKEVALSEIKTEVLVYANWASTSRVLRSNPANDGIFGEPLGIREDEGNLSVWSYGLAFRSVFKKNFVWQGGISWMRNGETFDYQASDSDSTFAYQNFYNYIAMPLKIMYQTGGRINFYGGVGLTPQLFFSFRQEQQWTTVLNTQVSETIKTRNGYNTFILSGSLTAGAQLRMNSGASIFVEPEYRFHLTNSYTEIDSYEHFGRAFGVNIGFTYPI